MPQVKSSRLTTPHWPDGNQVATRADYLAADYKQPAFKIHPLEKLFSFGRKKKTK